ncbi:MAG: hypothetical protein OXG88_03255 [Gammaproteobacteria bacterium]|nr:hypothetical protein [Gammaproteobacteria bacterium]
MFIFRTGVVGFGSTENNELDVRDNLDSVFQRILNVLDRDRVPRFLLPKDFWPQKRSYPATYANKRLENPVSGANIVGELSGDIGHGNYSVYFVLDSVFKRMNAGKFKFQRSIRTDCRIEISKGSRRRAHIQQRIEQFAGANQYFLLSR